MLRNILTSIFIVIIASHGYAGEIQDKSIALTKLAHDINIDPGTKIAKLQSFISTYINDASAQEQVGYARLSLAWVFKNAQQPQKSLETYQLILAKHSNIPNLATEAAKGYVRIQAMRSGQMKDPEFKRVFDNAVKVESGFIDSRDWDTAHQVNMSVAIMLIKRNHSMIDVIRSYDGLLSALLKARQDGAKISTAATQPAGDDIAKINEAATNARSALLMDEGLKKVFSDRWRFTVAALDQLMAIPSPPLTGDDVAYMVKIKEALSSTCKPGDHPKGTPPINIPPQADKKIYFQSMLKDMRMEIDRWDDLARRQPTLVPKIVLEFLVAMGKEKIPVNP